MPHKIDDDDYLDLWKYFQDRADNVKEAMFNSVTWTVGLAAAILGFIFARFVKYSGTATLELNEPWFTLVASLVGLVICVYAGILIVESKRHIEDNWERSKNCKEHVDGLDELLNVNRNVPRLQVWTRIALVVAFFVATFVVVLVCAICELR